MFDKMKEKIAHIQSYIIYKIIYVIIHNNYKNNVKVIFLITFLIHIQGVEKKGSHNLIAGSIDQNKKKSN